MSQPAEAAPAQEPAAKDSASPQLTPQVDEDQYKLLAAALGSPELGASTSPHLNYQSPQLNYQPYGVDHPPWTMGGGPCDVMPWQEMYMDPSAMYNPMAYPNMMGYGAPMESMHQQGYGNTKGAHKGKGKGKSGDRGERREPTYQQPYKQEGPVTYTTVMFRNIPNKYTRDMLVKQLEDTGLKGKFDYVYMPIDFKHQCNVGYAFINFRTLEACESFLQSFDNFEVNKAVGMNSRKVAEVTPARVQGIDENVARLRNSPVMIELSGHPEWMPLLFDDNGRTLPFPAPERPLAPIKPRKKAA